VRRRIGSSDARRSTSHDPAHLSLPLRDLRRTPRRAILVEAVLVVLGYLVVAVYATWPLARRPLGGFYGFGNDNWGGIWVYDELNEAYFGDGSTERSQELQAPFGYAMPDQVLQPMDRFYSLVFGGLGDGLGAYNAQIFLSFLFAGCTMYLLARYLTGSRLAAAVAGLIYTYSPFHLALAMQYNSLAAIGALLGALASARRARLRLRTIIFGAVLYGAMMMLAGIVPVYGLFLGVLIGIGLSRLLLMTAAETMVQLSSNLVIRGRVMAFWVMVILGGQAVGGPLMGTIAEFLGAKVAFVIAGGVPAVVAIAIAIVLARSGRLTVTVAPRRKGRWVAIVPRHQSRAITEPITIIDADAVQVPIAHNKLRRLRSSLSRSATKRRSEQEDRLNT